MKNKILITSLITIFLITGFLFSPFFANALSLYANRSIENIKIGDNYFVKIYIDTADKELNVIEGKLKISGNAEISSVDTSGSVFSMWTENPKVSGREITFTGGVEGGVYGKDLRVFNFVLTPKSKGNITITPIDIAGYLNDGKGTKVESMNSNIIISVDGGVNTTSRTLAIILLMFILFTVINILKKFKNKN